MNALSREALVETIAAADADRDDLQSKLDIAMRLGNQYEAAARLANRNTATATGQRDTARADADKLRYNLALAWAHIHARLHQSAVPKERCGEAMCRKLREAVDHG